MTEWLFLLPSVVWRSLFRVGVPRLIVEALCPFTTELAGSVGSNLAGVGVVAGDSCKGGVGGSLPCRSAIGLLSSAMMFLQGSFPFPRAPVMTRSLLPLSGGGKWESAGEATSIAPVAGTTRAWGCGDMISLVPTTYTPVPREPYIQSLSSFSSGTMPVLYRRIVNL